MQNFSSSPAAAASPGFSSRGVNMVGSSYPPHMSDSQISPRIIEDYAAMQQHQPILQSHGQHVHLRGQQHPGQVAHVHGYGSTRSEMPQAGGAHGGSSSSNSFRKESMDYYFSMSGRDRNRRASYGAAFGYANVDGHIPHPYRHISGSSSGMMSPYPMNYSTSAASSGGSASGGGDGSFSPSQQFNLSHNAAMQPIASSDMRQHQQGQKYPSHPGLHQGHRAYSLPSHRTSSQFAQFPPLGVPAASPGKYNSPPLRYEAGSMDSKVNNSPTHSNPNSNPSSVAPPNSGLHENVGQGFPPSNHPPYSPQSHPVTKHASRRTPQHSLGPAYEASLKIQHPPPSQPHLKSNQSMLSLSPAAPPHLASQDISKSPMHSQNQQVHLNQNFSPISNPSPPPSAVHSPSCSSSSSPLTEGLSNSASLHLSLLNPRASHSHARPQHTMAQLSPTPSSNSSISSCGSATNQKRVQVGPQADQREETSSSLYPQERISQDPGLNSLNALTSQVANLPNTVQHMMLSGTMRSQKKSRDGAQAVTNQQSSRNVGAASLRSSNEGDEDIQYEEISKDHSEQSEREKTKERVGIESKQANYYSPGSNQTQTQTGHPGLHSVASAKEAFRHVSKSVSQTKEPENQTSSSSCSPSPVPVYAEPSQNAPSCPPAPSASSSSTSSPTHAAQPNCATEPDLIRGDKPGLKDKGSSGMKVEKKTVKREADDGKNIQTLTCVKVEDQGPNNQDKNDNDEKKNTTEFCSMKNLNIPEQPNAGVGVIVSARSEQSLEGPKQTEGTTSFGKLNFSDDKHSINIFRNSANHNGDGAIGLEIYSAPYVSAKTEFGLNVSSNHCQPGPYKYNSPELPYSACMGTKNKGRAVPGNAIGASRYQDYPHPQSSFGSLTRKDLTLLGVMGRSGQGVGPRGHDNSQLQQPYPSLLQEVLQGYHLDRRYGRPEQTVGGHQPHNVSQHLYHMKLPYRMTENVRPPGSGAVAHPMATGKVHIQNHGRDHEVDLGLHHSSWDSEAPRPKEELGVSSQKGTTAMSPSHSTHVLSSDASPAAPPKHINLADYSLPHRKPPSLASPPSAVQQLLLQESDPLTSNTAANLSQLHASLSSGRRSVICDVSPSRRITPEKERGQFVSSGSSVIQQPHSFSALNEQECSKDNAKDKKQQEQREETSKEDLAKVLVDGHGAIIAKQEPTKSLHGPTDVTPDLQRLCVRKERTELPINPSYHSQLHRPPETLSSPPRCKPYSKAVGPPGLGFGFVDASEGSKVNTSHNAFYSLSASNHIAPSNNKLQTYPHDLPLQRPHNMGGQFDWPTNSGKSKDISANHNSVQNTDPKFKIQSPTNVLPNQHHLARQPSYPGSHCDMKIWEPFAEREGSGLQELRPGLPPHKSVGPRSASTNIAKSLDLDISRTIMEESAKKTNLPAATAGAGGTGSNLVTSGIHQGPRPSRTGSSETNPLMLRRRVRSFISPIPAKRQHQDSSHKAGSSYSPVAPSEPRLLHDNDSGLQDTRTKISPNLPYQASIASSPLVGKSKVLPPRKGRGLKLEAIVQKITPNKKASYSNSHADADYLDISHYGSDSGADTEIATPFSTPLNREGGCLPYLDEPHSLDDLLLYRAEDAYSCDSQDLKHGVSGSSGGTLRKPPTDFDFGLGTTVSSGPGMADGDKDEFTLLGPLPPPPPLPRPVQGSPPPSSSALSDIQQFTSTYQQLETRRGEQSAANLLRQKLQDTGMAFDNYPGGDFYGSTPSHGQSPGHHHLSRTPQHELASARSAADARTIDSFVPKGYFPSGKKKGRPVGSVNKQKRAQVQVQCATGNPPSAPQTPPSVASAAATPQPASNSSSAEEAVIMMEIPEQKPCLPLVELDAPAEPAKVEMEGKENQPEVDMKPVKYRQKKGRDGNDVPASKGKQWRKRGGMTPKEDLDPSADGVGNTVVLADSRKNVFSPYIHVEQKISEIGAVCTIINAEGIKSSGVDALANVSLTSQTVRREKEVERVQDKGIEEPTDSVLQSGKSIPTSGYVLPGPVMSETGHSGRLLCCLCQKWANYKNLGDLYGPFYPADYAAKFPKNQPQVRQTSSNQGFNTSSNPSSAPAELIASDTSLICPPNAKRADSSTTIPVSPAQRDNSPSLSANTSGTITETPDQNWEPMPNVAPAFVLLEPPDLENKIPERRQQQKTEDLQLRPQHRKLTSHPRFKRRHKSVEGLPRTIPINSKASLPFQPPPPSLDSLGPLGQLAQLPVVPLDPKELWVHESCIVWTSGVYLVNGKLYGLQEALYGARETSCSHCEMAGSTLGCYSKGCTLRYHYLCALEAECCLNEDNFSMRCPKHKFPSNGRPAKPAAAQLEQPERS